MKYLHVLITAGLVILNAVYSYADLQTYTVEAINDTFLASLPVPAPAHAVTHQYIVSSTNQTEIIPITSTNLRNVSITVENLGNGLIKAPYLYGAKGWDYRNISKLAGQIVADDPTLTNTEKAIRIHSWFDNIHWRYEVASTPISSYYGTQNFLRLENQYGGAMCGESVDAFQQLLYYVPPMGSMYGKKVQLNGHQTCDAYWDGVSHAIDCSPAIRWVYYNYDNTSIVPTYMDLKNDSILVKRIKPWTGWDTWINVGQGACTEYPLDSGMTPNGVHYNWDFNYNLRPNEKITYYFVMRGRFEEYTAVYSHQYCGPTKRNPTDYGSGVFTYKPDFTNTIYKSYAIETNITQGSNGLTPTNIAVASSIIFPIKSTWGIAGADIKAYFKTTGNVYIGSKPASSTATWRDTTYSGVVWQLLSNSQQEYGLPGKEGIEGRMAYWVKFEFTGAGSGLDSAEINTEVTINPRSMAGLEYGNNHINFEAVDLGGSTARVTYNYDDQSPYDYYEPATSNYGRHINYRVGGSYMHSDTRPEYWRNITANPNGTSQVAVQIYRVSGTDTGMVRTLKTLQSMHLGTYTWYWDGKDSLGRVCSKGMYSYKIRDNITSSFYTYPQAIRMYLWSTLWPIPNEQKNTDIVNPTATITQPSGTWSGGSTHNVQWTCSDNNAVVSCSLFYRINDLSPWGFLTSQTGSGSYSWNIPINLATSSAKLRVVAYDAANNSGESISNAFAITDTINPAVSLTSPTGGQSWAANSVKTINWNASDNVGISSRVVYYSFNNVTWKTIDSLSGNTGTTNWTVYDTTGGVTCWLKVKVYDAAGNSNSSVIAQPVTITKKPYFTCLDSARIPYGGVFNFDITYNSGGSASAGVLTALSKPGWTSFFGSSLMGTAPNTAGVDTVKIELSLDTFKDTLKLRIIVYNPVSILPKLPRGNIPKSLGLNIISRKIIAAIDKPGNLKFKAYDLRGARVLDMNLAVDAGYYAIPFQPNTGVYLIKMEHEGRTLLKKFMMVR